VTVCERTTRTGRMASVAVWGRVFVVVVMVEIEDVAEVVSLDEYGDLREAMAEFRRLR